MSLFLSCNSKSHGSSFISKLDSIDTYIAYDNTSYALKELKKLEKHSYNVFDILAIYKRYLTLGELKSAENCLKNGLKKNKNNLDITACYAKFLLNQNRLEESLNYCYELKESKYASIYAECLLKLAFSNTELKPDFFDEKYIDIYKDAYKGSKNSLWIQNASSILMHKGMFKEAAALYPETINSNQEALFWGTIFFDNGNYLKGVECLQKSQISENDFYLENLVLQSDSYYLLNDEENLEKNIDKIINFFESLSIDETETLLSNKDFYQKKIIQNAYINKALLEKKNNKLVNYYHTINKLNSFYPDYVPGISLFAQEAIENHERKPDDEKTQSLRDAGIKSLSMEEADALPIFTIDQAISKYEFEIRRNKNPELVISYEIFKDLLYKADGQERSISRLYQMLEKNKESKDFLVNEIVHYSILKLIKANQIDKAKSIFNSYLELRNLNIEENYNSLFIWEKEIAAWFYLKDENIAKAENLYKKIIQQYSNIPSFYNGDYDNSILINSQVNLSLIYSGTDRIDLALEQLNKASSICKEGDTKAEILFRIGELQYKNGDTRNSLRSLKYAIKLNKKHKKARLLLKNITNK